MMTLTPPPARPILGKLPGPGSPSRQIASAGRLLRGLLFKELRENALAIGFLWAVACVVVGFILVSNSQGLTRSPVSPFFLMDSGILVFSCIGCAISGFIHGWIPYRGTKAFDQWAFLVHRPISRTRLFLYRSFIGLALYAVTVGIPMGAFLLWAVSNQKATPLFHWRFLLPYAADFCLGAVTFFAASLTHQRQARAFASGVLPIAAAIVLVIATLALPHFSLVICVQFFACVCFGIAAWEGTVTHGEHTLRWVPARVSLFLTLLAGSLLPAFVIGAFAVSLLASIWTDEQQELRAHSQFNRRLIATVSVLQDGRYAIEVRDPSVAEHLSNGMVQPFFTLDGTPIQGLPPDARASHQPRASLRGAFGHGGAGRWRSYRDLSSIMRPFTLAGKNFGLAWYYFPHEGTVQGFDDAFRLCRSEGPSGLHIGNVPAERFPDAQPESPYYTRHAYYYHEFDGEEARLARVDIPDGNLLDATSGFIDGVDPYLVLLTDKNLQVFRGTPPARVATIPLTHAPRNYAIEFLINPETGGYLVRYLPELQPTGTWYFETYDATGNRLSATSLDPLSVPELREMLEWMVLDSIPRMRPIAFGCGMLTAFSMPVLFYPISWYSAEIASLNSPSLWSGILLVNAAAALTILLLIRPYSLSRFSAGAWSLATPIFGPWMLVVFLGSHHRVARISCPGCGKRRSVETETCPRCGAAFPTRNPSAVDIFAAIPAGDHHV